MIKNIKSYKFRLKKIFAIIILAFFMVMLVLYPEKYTSSCLTGLKLWAITVLPSLLPFFFLTGLLTATKVLNGISYRATKFTYPLIKCNGLSLYAFLMSILSGYPVGSRIVCDLRTSNLITKDEATKIGVLASTSGPLFVIGGVGIGMFNNKTIGVIIYISHVLSAILVGLSFRNYGKGSKSTIALESKVDQSNILSNSIYSAVISCLIVGGFISIFYVFAQILQDTNLLFLLEKFFELIFKLFGGDINTAKAFTIGLIECTSGAKQLSSLKNTLLSASLSCGLISFGGISIIMQSLVYLEKAEVKPTIFIFAKLLQTIISFIICFSILSIFNNFNNFLR